MLLVRLWTLIGESLRDKPGLAFDFGIFEIVE